MVSSKGALAAIFIASLFASALASMLALSPQAHAQATPAGDDAGGSRLDPKSSYDFGVLAGSFLPSQIAGVTEIVPGWGIRASAPTGKGVFEVGTFLGRGQGVTYYSGMIDYRMDTMIEVIPVHFMIGLHGDTYSSPRRTSGYSGGWHYGGGVSQEIAGPLLMRADFRARYGPGNALEIMLGIVYRMASGTGGGQ